jgi:hypothetical protein
MRKGFIELLIKIVEENSKELFKDIRRTKGLCMDYAKGEYKNLINLFIKTLELGFYNKIISSENLTITKLILVRQLSEGSFIDYSMAIYITDLLIGLLRDKDYLNAILKKSYIIENKSNYIMKSKKGNVIENIIDLNKDIINIFSYLDILMEFLPEEKIEEFAKSKYFDIYKSIFEKLEII